MRKRLENRRLFEGDNELNVKGIVIFPVARRIFKSRPVFTGEHLNGDVDGRRGSFLLSLLLCSNDTFLITSLMRSLKSSD